jgi:hypothetical protein
VLLEAPLCPAPAAVAHGLLLLLPLLLGALAGGVDAKAV